MILAYLFFQGSVADYPTKQGIPMGPMAYAPQQQGPPIMPHGIYDNHSIPGSVQGPNQMLDYLESQVRSMDVAQPLVHTHQAPPQHQQPLPPQHRATPPQSVPFSAGPPSMLSALDEIGVQGVERRVIQLPPIIGRGAGQPTHRSSGGTRGGGGGRLSIPSSDGSSRGGYRHDNRGVPRGPPSPRRGILRRHSDESDWDYHHGRRGGSSGGRRAGGGEAFRPRSRSRDDLMDELRHVTPRRDRSYSPPARRRGSWSSDDEGSRRGGGMRPSRGKPWPEKPPSYSLIDVEPGSSGRRNNMDRFSVRV